MTCPELPTEDLVAWLDDELDPGAAARVAAHVGACAACAREADLLRRSGDLVAALPRIAAPAGFDARVVAALTAPHAAPHTPARGSVVGRRAFRRWAVAAALVVSVAGAGWVFTRDGEGLSSRDEEAIARDLFVLVHLETLQSPADDEELARLADDLDVFDNAADLVASEDR